MFAILLIIYYVFGIILYDCIPQIQWIDELMPLVLLSYALFVRKGKISVSIIVFFAIALFYLGYSFYIHSNVTKAILFDFVVQAKPFITLFSVMMIAPKFTRKEMTILRYVLLGGAIIIAIAGLPRVGQKVETVSGEILTGARLSFAALYTGVAYLIFSQGSRKDLVVAFLITLLGFLAPTSKFLAGLSLLIVLFIFSLPRLKSYRPLMIIVALCVVAFFIYETLSDFSMFVFSDDTARAVMYLTAGFIFKDYLPFGSGLGSFGTSASANYYSDIYSKYGIDMIYGLTSADVDKGNAFMSDTGLVALAEFGVVGVALFVFVAVWLWRKSGSFNSTGFHLLVIFMILDIFIESAADSTLLGNRGVFQVMLLGILTSNRISAPNNCNEEKDD